MTIRQMREQRAKLLSDAQAIALKDNKTAEERAQVKQIMADAAVMLDDINTAEAIEATEAESRNSKRPPLPQLDQPSEDSEEVRAANQDKALRSYLAKGHADMDADLRKHLRAQTEGSGASGAYLIAPLFQRELTAATKAIGGALNAVRSITTDNGAPLAWPNYNDTSVMSTVITSGTTVSESDIAFGSITINVDQFTTNMVQVDNQLLQDSAFDLETELAKAFAIRMARGLNYAITNGTTSVQGLCASGVVANGVTTASGDTTTIGYDDIVNLRGSVDPSYRLGACYMLNDSTLNILIGLKDTLGRPLFQPNPTSGVFDRILGDAIVLNQAMAVPAADALTVMYGNFSNYILRNVQTLAVKRLNERYADVNRTAFVGFHRQGGAYINAGGNPIKSLVQAAS